MTTSLTHIAESRPPFAALDIADSLAFLCLVCVRGADFLARMQPVIAATRDKLARLEARIAELNDNTIQDNHRQRSQQIESCLDAWMPLPPAEVPAPAAEMPAAAVTPAPSTSRAPTHPATASQPRIHGGASVASSSGGPPKVAPSRGVTAAARPTAAARVAELQAQMLDTPYSRRRR